MAIETIEANLTVAHKQLAPSPDESYDEESFSASRSFKVTWDDRHDFARQLRGWIEGSWPNFIVHLPDRYPDVRGAFVRSVRMKGIGKSSAEGSDTDRISYADGYAEVTAQYSTKGQSEGQGGAGGDSPIAIVTESLEPAAEFVTLSGELLHWEAQDGPEVEDGEATVLARSIEWVYTIHQLTTMPAAFINLVGFVNNSQVFSHSLNFTFDPEVLLYQGASPRRIITTEGVEAWEATLRFTARRFGWNKWWRSGYNEPQSIYTSTGEYKPFPQANFVNQLVLP